MYFCRNAVIVYIVFCTQCFYSVIDLGDHCVPVRTKLPLLGFQRLQPIVCLTSPLTGGLSLFGLL